MKKNLFFTILVMLLVLPFTVFAKASLVTVNMEEVGGDCETDLDGVRTCQLYFTNDNAEEEISSLTVKFEYGKAITNFDCSKALDGAFETVEKKDGTGSTTCTFKAATPVKAVDASTKIHLGQMSQKIDKTLSEDCDIKMTLISQNNPKTGAETPFIILGGLLIIGVTLYTTNNKKKAFGRI